MNKMRFDNNIKKTSTINAPINKYLSLKTERI